MSLQRGEQGQHYVIKESTQGTTPAVAASNACRHRTIALDFDNKNRRTINEKRQSPWANASLRTDGRKSGSFSYEGILRPSGTIQITPEVDPYLEAGFGAKTNPALTTTVASGGSVSGATLASAGSLVKDDAVLITCPDGKKRVRFLTANPAGAVVAWAPNLPAGQQPANGAAVKSMITYKMTPGNVITLSILHYLTKIDASAGLKRAADMAMVDELTLVFDANDDPIIQATGPCKEVVDPPAQPGGFTMKGSQPPSGITGDMVVGNTAMPFLKCNWKLKNGLWLRNDEYGVAAASEGFRKDDAELSVGINCRAEDESVLYDLTEAGTNVGLFVQGGYGEGNAMAVRGPTVEVKPPKVDDPTELVNFDFTGMGLGSADGVNDLWFFAI